MADANDRSRTSKPTAAASAPRSVKAFLTEKEQPFAHRDFLARSSVAALVVAAALACFGAVPHAAAALVAGTVVFSFGELLFSSAVPAAVARLAPHAPNFTPVGSMSLYGGARLRGWQAFVLPLALVGGLVYWIGRVSRRSAPASEPPIPDPKGEPSWTGS